MKIQVLDRTNEMHEERLVNIFYDFFGINLMLNYVYFKDILFRRMNKELLYKSLKETILKPIFCLDLLSY